MRGLRDSSKSCFSSRGSSCFSPPFLTSFRSASSSRTSFSPPSASCWRRRASSFVWLRCERWVSSLREPCGFVKSIGLFPKASIGVFVTLAIWEPFCFSLDQASPQPTSSPPCSSWRRSSLPSCEGSPLRSGCSLNNWVRNTRAYRAKTWKLIPFVF